MSGQKWEIEKNLDEVRRLLDEMSKTFEQIKENTEDETGEYATRMINEMYK